VTSAVFTLQAVVVGGSSDSRGSTKRRDAPAPEDHWAVELEISYGALMGRSSLARAAVLTVLVVVPLLAAGCAQSAAAHRLADWPTGVQLRILTCCDSITAGDGSSDHNGYRAVLGDWLIGPGALNAEWVGSQKFGNYFDPYNEGHGGYTIARSQAHITAWLTNPPPDYLPTNLVLLDIGTNDAVHAGRTGQQMLADYSMLLDTILAYSPDVRVIAATLFLSTARNGQGSVAERQFNAGLPALVASKGPRVALADMAGIPNLADGIHPNDAGYRKMAYQWYQAMQPLYGAGGFFGAVPCPWDRC